MFFYSKATGGFYTQDIHGDNIPEDAVQITKQYYDELFDGQAQGKQILADDNGVPVLVEPVLVNQTYAEKRAYEYPPIQDYLDGIVKGDQDQVDAYIAQCLAVKAKYPK